MVMNLNQAVASALTLFEVALRNPERVDLDNDAVLKMYLRLVADIPGVSAEAIELAAEDVLRSEEYLPKPVTFRRYVNAAARRLYHQNFQRVTAGWVYCLDEHGYPTIAPPERVRAGLLLPDGDRSGDGSPALPSGEASGGGRAVLASLRQRDNAAIRGSGLRRVAK